MTNSTISNTVTLGGDLEVARIGYGTMQLLGPGYWGPPSDHDAAIRVLRAVVDQGVTFIDTADAYGPFVSEDLIREALHPYPENLVIATKGGVVRTGPNEWPPLGRPEYLRQAVEMSLRRLNVDRIDLYQLHRIDPAVPMEDSLGELVKLRDEGKIRYLGLSEVSVDELKQAAALTQIVSVQNLYNVTTRSAEPVLEYAQSNGMAFIPWFPMATGELAKPGGPLEVLARRSGVTAGQLALAWLLRRSPALLPIPGTSSLTHLTENLAATRVELTDDQSDALTAMAG